MIVSGSTQGLSLISSLLYESGKEVIIEDPTHPGLRRVIQMSGHELKEIQVDDLGINTQLLEDSNRTSFLYTTPSHQYPLGGVLPVQRRLDLIEYAKRNHCYIFEDDYDSEFRYTGAPISALRELAPEQVIYSGSFSKILSPALRLGYLILPEDLIKPYLTLKQYSDVHSEALTQYVLADFIQQGDLERYTLKMKKIYEKKRLHLLKELSAYFTDTFQIKGQAAGLHVILTFPKITFTKELCCQLQEKGIKIYPISNYYTTAPIESIHDVLLGYAHLELHEISEGIRILWEGFN
jgi:GntR family transcriptional regulator/MocR family aminotransferase